MNRTSHVVTDLLTGQDWNAGLGSALLTGGVLGGIAGEVGYKIRQWISQANAGSRGGVNTVVGGEIQRFEAMSTRTRYQRHHLVEQRLAERLGIQPGKIPSVYLTPSEHQPFANACRALIGDKKVQIQ